MQFYRNLPQHVTASRVLAIGNFDGLHLGHRALLDKLIARARALGLPPAVMTFEPHPRELFAPEQAPTRLTSLREKLELLEDCGIEEVFLLRFNRITAALSANDFIEKLLLACLSVRHLIVGDDFRFGKGRSGDFALLQAAGQQHGFGVESLSTIAIDGARVSSSAVRQALADGQLEQAAQFLGRPYCISGRVVHGAKLGRQLSFPTANIQLKRKRVPLCGIFATTVSGIDDDALVAAASLGVRPTLGDELRPLLEVHLLDFDRDIYGKHVTVNFLHKLRDEEKYASLELLRAQISKDVEAIRDYFAAANSN